MTTKSPKTISKAALTLFFCCAMLAASAQGGYKYVAKIPPVDSAGFYKIILQPAFIAKSAPGLYDLRLADAKDSYVAYLTAVDMPQQAYQQFTVFPQVAAATKTDTGSSIVVENKDKLLINRLWVKLRSTAVSRTLSILGSDDLVHWFGIGEDVALVTSNPNGDGTFIQSQNFPNSNFHYFKMIVNDKNKAPVKFLEAGIYTSRSLSNKYVEISAVQVMQRDSGRSSYISIKLNDNYQVNKLHLSISGPKFFKRRVSVYTNTGKTPSLVKETDIISADNNDLFLSVKSNKLLLEVDNEDNPPLKITAVQAYQTEQYIIGYLEAKQPYALLTGNEAAEEPSYDLKFFTDSIKATIPAITPQAAITNPAYSIPVVKEKHEYTVIIWGAIAVALLLLILLTRKMVGEVSKRDL